MLQHRARKGCFCPSMCTQHAWVAVSCMLCCIGDNAGLQTEHLHVVYALQGVQSWKLKSGDDVSSVFMRMSVP